MRLAPLLIVAFAAAASAQAPDTLDWHRYYPLAVGNVWEYHNAELGGDFRHTIIADTVVGGRTYFVRRTDYSSLGSPVPPGQPRLDYVRYDERPGGGGGVVSLSSLSFDEAVLRPCDLDDEFERDLQLAFGARAACGPPPGPSPDSVFVEGQYNTTWRPDVLSGTSTPVAVAAVKYFSVGIIFTTFVADVGPVASGNLWGPRLHYAVIDGVAYGTPELVIPELGGPLTTTDATVTLPDDPEFALANLTLSPVVLDSLAMRFASPSEINSWSTQSASPGPGGVSCYFSRFEPTYDGCAIGEALAPGATFQLVVGYDPCPICRAEAAGARRGGAPDTLLVYSGGVAVPDTVLFDDSRYVGSETEPASGQLGLAVGPNPSRGAAAVTLTAVVSLGSVRVVLVDALGRRVAVLHDGALPGGASRLSIPPGLPTGVYTVRAHAGATASARFTVVR